MSTKTTAPRTSAPVWETLPVVQLAAQVEGIAPDAELTASVQGKGIEEPLYVVTSDRDGAVNVVDGRRRLAAALAAGLDTVPVTYRPLIAVAALAAHPGNVRRDLKLTKLRASLRAEGRIITPIVVTRTAAGLRVVDGHRRLAAAQAEKWTHVPYVYDERGEADQYVDMVTTATQRESLSLAEESTALFAASELGAGVRRLAAASGRTQKEVKEVIRVGKSDTAKAAVTAQEAAGRYGALTLEDLGRLVELEELDEAAARKMLAAIESNPHRSADYEIRRALAAAQERAKAEAHRVALVEAGARILLAAELSDSARPVSKVPRMTADQHETCQGHAWVLEDGRSQYTPYCTNVITFGHITADQAAKEAPKGTDAARKEAAAARRAVIQGNRDWEAATERRREWLAKLVGAKKHSRATTDRMMSIMALALLSGGGTITAALLDKETTTLRSQLIGVTVTSADALSAVAQSGPKAAVHGFATVVACYETKMPRGTWRTDATGEAIYSQGADRRRAALYLPWLVEFGYEPVAIERAVMAGETYDPTATPQPPPGTAGDTHPAPAPPPAGA
ncbi:ParB/RepB/Spo0J family partition protein [Streptomyces sp. NPDC056290]|uniref:ParB/RepB/Spo0J family partition protein n=1 Tax=Streptomyces sp. NPDC056290 TaxID=3345771 RepID=UPI0035D5C33A